MSLDHARTKLAKAQCTLVEALIRGTTIPVDFDFSRLQAAAVALARKRARGVARAWPALERALGERFPDRFADFAATAAIPGHGGPLADGRAFVRYLVERGELPAEIRLEAIAVDLQQVAVHDGLVPRRWATARIAWFPGRFGLVLGVRVPWLGEFWWSTKRGLLS